MSALLSLAAGHGRQGEYEFPFEAADFDRVRKMIYRRAGISLHAGKKAMVYSRLSRRLRALGQTSFGGYLDALERAAGPAGEREWQEFINCLTTNLTSFFREEHHFPLLAAELRKRGTRGARVWCNAASTGEEPYSIAMTVIETLGAQCNVKMACSDIDTNVLASAARGVYPADARGLSTERLQRHFLAGRGANEGFIRVKPEVQRLIEFKVHNLIGEPWAPGEIFDIVFCRNVMIYFDGATQRRVLERMHSVMKPQGLLFGGHSENFTSSRDLFRLRGKTVYERV